MSTRILNRLPIVLLLMPPLGGIFAFFVTGTPYNLPFRIALYLVYAISASVIAYGLVTLCRRTEDGRASIWLVAVMYEQIFFALTLWGVLSILAYRYLTLPAVVPPAASVPVNPYFEQFVYALIGTSTTGTAISALVLIYGFFVANAGALGTRIEPWPWKFGDQGGNDDGNQRRR